MAATKVPVNNQNLQNIFNGANSLAKDHQANVVKKMGVKAFSAWYLYHAGQKWYNHANVNTQYVYYIPAGKNKPLYSAKVKRDPIFNYGYHLTGTDFTIPCTMQVMTDNKKGKYAGRKNLRFFITPENCTNWYFFNYGSVQPKAFYTVPLISDITFNYKVKKCSYYKSKFVL